MVPVSDQDAAIAFYTEKLGFSKTADVPFAEDDRWVEVSPPGGGATIALVRPQSDWQPGVMTNIALDSSDRGRTTKSSRRAASMWTRSSWGATARCRCSSSSVI